MLASYYVYSIIVVLLAYIVILIVRLLVTILLILRFTRSVAIRYLITIINSR